MCEQPGFQLSGDAAKHRDRYSFSRLWAPGLVALARQVKTALQSYVDGDGVAVPDEINIALTNKSRPVRCPLWIERRHSIINREQRPASKSFNRRAVLSYR